MARQQRRWAGLAARGGVVGKAVEAVFTRTGRVWVVRAGGRLILTTGEHPLFRLGDGWTAAQEVVPGDKLGGRSGWAVAVEGVRDTVERLLADHLPLFAAPPNPNRDA